MGRSDVPSQSILKREPLTNDLYHPAIKQFLEKRQIKSAPQAQYLPRRTSHGPHAVRFNAPAPKKSWRITSCFGHRTIKQDFASSKGEHGGGAARVERLVVKRVCRGRLTATIGSKSCPVCPSAKETLDHAKRGPKTRGLCNFRKRLDSTPPRMLPLGGRKCDPPGFKETRFAQIAAQLLEIHASCPSALFGIAVTTGQVVDAKTDGGKRSAFGMLVKTYKTF